MMMMMMMIKVPESYQMLLAVVESLGKLLKSGVKFLKVYRKLLEDVKSYSL